MRSAVCIPYPVVCIERRAVVGVYSTIEGAPVATVLTHTYRAFECTVIGSVEHLTPGIITALHCNTTEYTVPFVATTPCLRGDIVILDFAAKILLCLFLAYERYSVAHPYAGGAILELPYGTYVASLSRCLLRVDYSVAEDTGIHRCSVAFGIDIYTCASVEVLIAGRSRTVYRHTTIPACQRNIHRLSRAETYSVHTCLMRRRIIGMHRIVVEVG